MNRDFQKKQELIAIDQFRQSFPEFPKGKLVPSESPDFILKATTKKWIGIELTSVGNPGQNGSLNSQIIEIVNFKNQKYRSYNSKHIAQHWLIITIDFFNADQLVAPEALSELKDSFFQKIYFFELFNNKISCLKK